MSSRVPPIEQANTRITHVDEPLPPVFADPSGLRRRRLRRLSCTVLTLLLLLLLAFWLSQLSGDTSSGLATTTEAILR